MKTSTGADGAPLLHHTDMAMYRTKASGRNQYCFFENTMNEAAARRLRIEARLHEASLLVNPQPNRFN